MKQYSKSIIALFCGLLSATFALSAGQISKTVSFTGQSLSVNQTMVNGVTYSDLSFGDLINGAETGAPALPRKYVAIALPANAANIRVSSVSVNKGNTTQLIFPVIPEREPVPTNGTPEPSLSQDKEIYESESAYPSSAVNICSVIDYWGVYAVVGLQITPMEYFPSYGEVRTYNDVSFTLSYDLDTEYNHTNYLWQKMSDDERVHTLNLLKEDVFNPEDVNIRATTISSRPMKASADPDFDGLSVGGIRVYTYSIITSRALGKAFERLASLKRQTGLDAGIIYIEDILANPLVQCGDILSCPIINAETGEMSSEGITDDAGKLRYFLFLATAYTDLKYVLLGGKSPIIPIRYGTVGSVIINGKYISDDFPIDLPYESISDEYHIPTDWYFMDFSRNWNQDGDHFYGEYKEKKLIGDDRTLYSAQLYLGRIPCTTAEEVNNYIDKLEFYLLNPGRGGTSYLNSAYTHFSREGVTSTSTDIKANISSIFKDHDTYMQPLMASKEIYEKGPELVAKLNLKNYALLDFHCHGNPCTLTAFDINRNDWHMSVVNAIDNELRYGFDEALNGLDNIQNFGYPGIMYSISCDIAPFDAPNYCGYELTDNLYNHYRDVSTTISESYLLGKNYGGVAMIVNTRSGYFNSSYMLERNFFNGYFRGGFYSEIGSHYNSSKYGIDTNGLDASSTGYFVRLSQNLLGDPQLRIWLGDPIKLTEFNVSRGSNYVGINWSGDYGATDASQCEAIVVDPDGIVHKSYMSGNLTSFSVSANASASVIGNNMLPYIGDLSLQNITFDKYSYVYAKGAEIGSQIRKRDQGDVVFASGAEYVIDATDAVDLKKGTVIKNGAILRVISPVSCSLDSITIEEGGILEVHSPKLIYCKGTRTTQFTSTQIKTYGYDKYGDENALTWVLDMNGRHLTSQRKSDYIPMFEIGKTWKYTIHDCRWCTYTWDPDTDFILRVDGTTEIDGKEYFVVNAYTGGATTPDNNTPYGYFREDSEERIVYYLPNHEYGHLKMENIARLPESNTARECVLIDFNNYSENLGFNQLVPLEYIHSEFNALDGIHNGFTVKDPKLNGLCGCYEGLGIVFDPEYYKSETSHFPIVCPYEITGFSWSTEIAGCKEHWPFLYAICAPDGTEIYSFVLNLPDPNDDRPGVGGIDGVSADRNGRTEIAYEDGVVRVRSDREIGEVSVAGMQGAMVKYMQINEPTAEIPVDDLQPGVYVVKAADATAKIVIR